MQQSTRTTPNFPMGKMALWAGALILYSATFMRAQSGLASFLFFGLWMLWVADALFGLRRATAWIGALGIVAAIFVLLESKGFHVTDSPTVVLGFYAIWGLMIAHALFTLRKVVLWTVLLAIFCAAFATAVDSSPKAVARFAASMLLVAVLRPAGGPKRVAAFCALGGAALWPAFIFARAYDAVRPVDVLLAALLGAMLGAGLAALNEACRMIIHWVDQRLPTRSARPSGDCHPRLHFNLAQMLTAMMLLSLPLCWIAAEFDQARRNREAATRFAEPDLSDLTMRPRKPNWLESMLNVTTPVESIIAYSNPDPDFDDIGLVNVFAYISEPNSLRYVNLRNSNVSGRGLRLLREASRLEIVYLDGTNVGNDALGHLKTHAALRSLDLGSTNISDAGLQHLERLRNLEFLNLSHTKISDAGLQHLEHLHRLKRLDLSYTEVSDAGLRHLKELTNLDMLRLDHTRVGDKGLSYLGGLVNLRVLSLAGANATDLGMVHLEKLSNANEIRLSGTRVSRKGLTRLRRALPRCRVSYYWGPLNELGS